MKFQKIVRFAFDSMPFVCMQIMLKKLGNFMLQCFPNTKNMSNIIVQT